MSSLISTGVTGGRPEGRFGLVFTRQVNLWVKPEILAAQPDDVSVGCIISEEVRIDKTFFCKRSDNTTQNLDVNSQIFAIVPNVMTIPVRI